MTNPRRQNNPVDNVVDELIEEPVALFAVLAGLALAGPALLLAFWNQAVAWALEHALIVPAAQASWTIPSTHTGLDGRRIIAAALLLVAIAAGSVALVRSSRRGHASKRGDQ